MVETKNEFGQLNQTELDDFEMVNGIRLPEEYRKFLLDSNGGTPSKRRCLYPDTIVTYLLGMHNGPMYASIYKHIDIFSRRLPLSTIPIATDPFGNLFIMSVHPESTGAVYFWDHEGESETQNGHFTDNCYFVAERFSDFLENLVVE